MSRRGRTGGRPRDEREAICSATRRSSSHSPAPASRRSPAGRPPRPVVAPRGRQPRPDRPIGADAVDRPSPAPAPAVRSRPSGAAREGAGGSRQPGLLGDRREAAGGPVRGREQLVAEVGVRDRGERLEPRWRTVRPCSSAAPCSVMTTSTWWRGVVTTGPAADHGTIRERARRPHEVEGRHSSERSSRSRPAPATKSSWPPMPENCEPPIVSATTWPWRSIASAPLIETKRGCRAITSAELTTSTGRNRTSSFSCSQS